MVQKAQHTAEDNLAFVLTCWQSSDANRGKIDFENIASTLGVTKHSAYVRLYNLKKKAGFGTAAAVSNNEANESVLVPSNKRGCPVGSGKGPKAKKQRESGVTIAKDIDDAREDGDDDVGGDVEGVESEEKATVKLEGKEEEH